MSNDIAAVSPAILGAVNAPGIDASSPAVLGAVNAPGVDRGLPAVAGSLTMANQLAALAATSPPITSSLSIYAGNVYAISASLPVVTAELRWATSIEVSLPATVFEAAGLSGSLSGISAHAPVVALSASMVGEGLLALSAVLPAVLITAAAHDEGLGTITATLRPVSATVTALSGAAATALVSLPAPTGVLNGYGPYTLSIAAVLPAVFFDATAMQAVATAFRTWALNTRKKALTEYDGFTFNSYAVLDGVVLAASSTGLFKLSGQDTDAGTDIDAVVRTGQEKFATTFNKRVPRIYAGYEATGPLRFVTITSQDGRRAYQLPHNNLTGIQQRRVPVGRGPKSVYWQFEVANETGADFLIDHLDLYPEVSKRRSP